MVEDGEEYMTPLDMVRAMTPGVPPSPNSRPINIPMFESPREEPPSKEELPDFFKFGPGDSGLISFQRFLVIVTLLALPAAELAVAYRMCGSSDFRNVELRAKGLKVANFDFMLERNVKVQGQGYSTDHDKGDIVFYLFGDALDRTLSFEEFRGFHSDLRENVERMQYFLLSDKLVGGEPSMSLVAFAKSVAALVPSTYRSDFLERAEAVDLKAVSAAVVEQQGARGLLPAGWRGRTKDRLLGRDVAVSYEDYVNWQEILRSLVQMEETVRRYSYADGKFTPTNINRAAYAVTGVRLSKAQAWVLFHLFDGEGTGELFHDQFLRLLSMHTLSTKTRFGSDGLGLGSLLGCVQESCAVCVRNWMQGTKD